MTQSQYATLLEENRALKEQNSKLLLRLDQLLSLMQVKESPVLTVKEWIQTLHSHSKFNSIKPVVKEYYGIPKKVYDTDNTDEVTTDDIIEIAANVIDKGYAPNSLLPIFANFKISLKGYTDLVDALSEARPTLGKIASQKIALTMDELLLFESVVPDNAEEELAKDCAVLMCRVGMRVSDALKVTEENVNNGVLEYIATKTTQLCRVKITKDGMALIKKIQMYGLNVETESDLKHFRYIMNKWLPIIAKKAGITTRQSIFKRGEKRIVERWEVFTSHCCRCTFATLAYIATNNLPYVQGALGHTKPEQTLRYIKTPIINNSGEGSF